MSDARQKAWETRRQKYGPAGHGPSAYASAASRYLADLRRQNEARYSVCDDEPRLFIRRLRAILEWNDGDPEFELSEGQATALLAERERRAVERATPT